MVAEVAELRSTGQPGAYPEPLEWAAVPTWIMPAGHSQASRRLSQCVSHSPIGPSSEELRDLPVRRGEFLRRSSNAEGHTAFRCRDTGDHGCILCWKR